MRKLIIASAAILLVSSSLWGADLSGRWEGTDAEGNKHVFVFQPSDQVTWSINRDGQETTMNIRYRLDTSPKPHHIAFMGFESGPLEGLALFGILEFTDAKTIRFDVDAGEPDDDPADVRPDDFGDRTMTLKKTG